jgi:translation initiation factor 5A
MGDEIEHETIKNIRPGRFVLIDGVACRVVDIETSSPGKHGSAKVRLTGMTIFGNGKKTIVKPGDADIDVPIVNKAKAQVVSTTSTSAQLMDSDTYEVYELPIPEDLLGKLNPGTLVEVMDVMNQKLIARILSN